MAEPFVREINVDYSDDELDALATAFGRSDLARRPERVGGDPVRRAQHQTALRGLVARRAIMLSGTPARPRIAFLDPHATILGAWLGATAVATVRTEAREAARSVSLFVHRDVVVHQLALPGQAIQRLTAYGRDAASELLEAELGLAGAKPADEAAAPVEVTARMVTKTLEAHARSESPPDCVPAAAVDLLHARIASGSLTITARGPAAVRSAERWAWIDAGELGLWRVRGGESTPTLQLQPADPPVLHAEMAAAWAVAAEPAETITTT